jgi:hypothetical protein
VPIALPLIDRPAVASYPEIAGGRGWGHFGLTVVFFQKEGVWPAE